MFFIAGAHGNGGRHHIVNMLMFNNLFVDRKKTVGLMSENNKDIKKKEED
jgi:hypothetical protein